MDKDEYTKEIILAQWQTCVDMANSVSQRRDVMNNLFVTLNLALIAMVSVVQNVKSILIILSGIGLCFIWMLFIQNFKALNKEKFHVINEIERELPFQPFNKEWELIKNNKKYIEETRLEKILPIAFIILYVVAAIYIIFTEI